MYDRDDEFNYFIKDMRTFVPLIFVAEELDFSVEYMDSSKEIVIKKDDKEI